MKANHLHQHELLIDHLRPLSVEGAASVIGVSTATIRNWVKAGYLSPTGQRPLLLDQQEVLGLKSLIASGDVARLRARANKSTSGATSIPTEYMGDASVAAVIEAVAEMFGRENISISALLFLTSLRILEIREEVLSGLLSNEIDISHFHSWKRKAIREEISKWFSAEKSILHAHTYRELSRILHAIPNGDLIGLIYQALASEGDKSTKGSYYTPPEVVATSLSYEAGAVSSFLDPCCGTGQYLLCAAKTLKLHLEDIYGFDNDELATRIARINLLIAFPQADMRPNVECLDTITELATGEVFCSTNHMLGSVDFIATNPPWGAFKNRQLAAHLTNGVRSNEAFSLILAKSIKLLKDGGRLSFILPESILKIRIHADIREMILTHTRVLRISHLGRQFSGVFTPVIRLDLLKEAPSDSSQVSIENQEEVHKVDQRRFLTNDNFVIDANVTESEDRILERLYANEFVTLKGNADWALGIVTGNNQSFIKDQPQEEMEAIFKGSDVCKFVLKEPSNYLHFTPEKFQQVAKVGLYRAPEKLIYKFISSKLVFAFDDRQRLTLNSANILIPRLPEISTKVALGFLNSNVFQYIFSKKFSTHKVLRGDLEGLPFPRISRAEGTEIEGIVDQILTGHDRVSELNRAIYSAFRITPEDVDCIEKTLFQ